MNHALVFANGDIIEGPMVQRALSAVLHPYVVAADGGARVARHYHLPIDAVVGDMDSLSPEDLDALKCTHTTLRSYPAEKNETDLELALLHVAAMGHDWVRIIGGYGGRIDQTIGNIYLLALPDLQNRDVRMVAGKQEAYLLYPGTHHIQGDPGDTVSLIPIAGAVHGIRTQGLYYPLKGETLDFGPARGISNLISEADVSVALEDGVLLVIHTIGRA